MMIATLSRLEEEEKQTLGEVVFINDGEVVLSLKTLELPDRGNARSISRINAGKYLCKRRTSKKYGEHYILLGVEGRDYILIHFGNFYRDTRGCILLGTGFKDIDKDGYRDVINSKNAMKQLLEVAPVEFELMIIDQ